MRGSHNRRQPGPRPRNQVGHRRRALRHLWGDRGQVLVLWAVVLVAVLGVAGLAVNVGTVYFAKGQLQSAVDSAALAGAQVASEGGTNVAGQKTLIPHNDHGASGTVGIDQTNPMLVDANASQLISGGFASLFGIHKFSVRAHAAASFGPGLAFNYAIFSGKQDANLEIPGGGNIYGGVHSNDTISIKGGVTITGVVNAASTIDVPNYEKSQFKLQSKQHVLSMPQWNVPSAPPKPQLPAPPAISPSTSSVTLSNQTAAGPIYTDGANVTIRNSHLTSGGIYVNGGSVTIGGDSTVTGNIVVTGGGSVNISGGDPVNGSIYVTGGGNVSAAGDVSGGIFVSGGGSVNVGGGRTVGHLPSSAFPANAFTNPKERVGIIDYGGYGVTGASITVQGGDSVNGDVIDTGSFINIYGGDSVTGNVLATQGNGSSNCYIDYAGGGKTGGYVVDEGGSVHLGGSTATGNTAPGLTVADFPYKGQGGTGVDIQGGASFQGVIYAPKGPVTLHSNTVYGSIVGQTVSIGGGSTVHYNASVVARTPFSTIALVQ